MIANVSQTENGFVTFYKGTKKVCSIEAIYSTLTLKINYFDNSVHRFCVENVESYQAQFGLSVSKDERYVFIQDWDRGLFCYEIESGALIWANKKKRVSHLLVSENHILGYVENKGLLEFDVLNGSLINEHKMTAEFLCPIDEDLFFIGPIKRKWKIISVKELSTVFEIPDKVVNRNGCISFIVNDARIEDKALIITGFEQDENEMLQMKEMRPYEYKIDLLPSF